MAFGHGQYRRYRKAQRQPARLGIATAILVPLLALCLMDCSASRTNPASLNDLGDQLLEVIVLKCKGSGSTRLVCNTWKTIVDNSDSPFCKPFGPVTTHTLKVQQRAYLKTPKNASAAEGCLSWCRRQGVRIRDLELSVESPWWLLPCSPLMSWTDLSRLELDISTPQLTSLEPIAPLTNLKHLRIWDMEGLSSLQSLSSLPQLELLCLQDCQNITDLQPLTNLTHLTWLGVYNCGIEDLRSLSLPGLQFLGCSAISCSGISTISSLTSLAFDAGQYGDFDLTEEEWEEFQHLPSLAELRISMNSFGCFSCLRSSSLTELEICGALCTVTAADLRGVQNLRKLCLTLCFDIKDFSPLSNLRNLEELIIADIAIGDLDVHSLTSLSCLTGLRSISFLNCGKLNDPPVDLSVLRGKGVRISDEGLR